MVGSARHLALRALKRRIPSAAPQIWIRSWRVSFSRSVPAESDRARLGEEAWGQGWQGIQPNISLQIALACPDMGIKLGFKSQFCPLLVSCVSLSKLFNLSEPHPHG